MEKSKRLADIFDRVRAGENPERVRSQARLFLANLSLKDITKAYECLLPSCVSLRQLRSLVYAFASVIGDQFALLRASVSPNHPVRKILAEHDMFEIFLADLADVNQAIQAGNEITPLCAEYRKLMHATEHLQTVDLHNQLEDNLLFTALENYPCYSVCKILQNAHLQIKSLMNSLYLTVSSLDRLERPIFAAQLNSLVEVIVPTLREHIFFEDNILLPAAIETIRDQKVWQRIKELSDDMDYCAFDALPCFE